jgi:Ca2+-binding RTX toxin-like protein
MRGAFDDNGTPGDFSDDEPKGTPLPCRVRESSSTIPFQTGAKVTDCVDGTGAGTEDLSVPQWLADGAPSLTGVQYRGSIYHQGRGAGGAATPAFSSDQDIDFDHEAELTNSGRFLVATDERGGGITPPGATCSPGVDNLAGNGGVHFYRRSGLSTSAPANPAEAHEAYARTPGGAKAIHRVPIRTQPRATVCTAHVFQQIPGQNRIFMAWYSQGTQVIDFVESPNGTVRFEEAGYFIPANANEWVSAVFKVQRNASGSFTYWGATGDFNLGEAGRNAIDVWKVTFPPAPVSAPAQPPPGAPPPSGGGGGSGGPPPPPGTGGAPDFGDPGACGIPIRGTSRAERLLGSIAGDRILGRAGDDRINARAGNDCVRGQRGRDQLRGGGGADLMRGGPGRDLMRGGPGADRLFDRWRGRDRFHGGAGPDLIRARGGGGDLVACGKGGRDRAIVDQRDRVRGCEVVKRPR